MASVNGTAGNDFIHRAGDGRVAPAGYDDITGVTTEDDIINGLAGADILDGGPGNDMLTGGPGPDAFVFAPGYGNDTITDFTPEEGDWMDLSAFAAIGSASQVQVLAAQVGADTVLNFGNGDTLTLTGVTEGALTPSDFLPPSARVGFMAPILSRPPANGR